MVLYRVKLLELLVLLLFICLSFQIKMLNINIYWKKIHRQGAAEFRWKAQGFFSFVFFCFFSNAISILFYPHLGKSPFQRIRQ